MMKDVKDTAVLTIGESLVDIVVDPSGRTSEHPGGSPLNVAVALGRLGHASYLATRLGDDERGRTVVDHVAASHVRLAAGSVVPGARTSTAIARLDEDRAADYLFDVTWELPADQPLPGIVDAVHVGSIGAVMLPGADRVLDLVAALRGTATISFDPNVRPGLMGDADAVRPRITRLMALADVVKASDEDLAWLFPGTEPEDVLRELVENGTAVAVMTRGARGAVGHCAAGRVVSPPIRAEVADTVGAGDTFSAGLLDALAELGLLGDGRREKLRRIGCRRLAVALTHAGECAAVTVSRPGADPPWARELTPARPLAPQPRTTPSQNKESTA
jgi:fructokinase